MKEFTVFFELYGKKMQVKTTALNDREAEKNVLKSVIFHKTVQSVDNNRHNHVPDVFKDIFGGMGF